MAGVKYGGGIKSQGAGGSDYPEAAAGKDNRTAETRCKAGEDLLSTALRENKHEAGFPNHLQINETDFKSQTKALRVLHAAV